MKTLINISLFFLGFLFFSCNTNDNIEPIIKPQPKPIVKEKINGFVQKGPFLIGTAITITELDSILSQSGRNFSTQITNNNGNFEIKNIVLNNSLVEIKADGFYFNEVRGKTSENRLTLYALSDLSDQNTVNVNVLSYLEKARIEYLVGGGKSFAEAKKQAQKEVLAIFEVEKENIACSEQLDISKSGEDNAILLAISVILQGKRNVAELLELMARISLDIREDGKLDDPKCGSDLINHARLINLNGIRSNIENKYLTMGETDSIPGFEKIVANFIAKTGFVYTLKFEYPRNGKYGINLLSLEENETIISPASYSLKALLPEGFKLKIKITQTTDNTNGASWFFHRPPEGEISSYTYNSLVPGKIEWFSKENITDADHEVFFEGKGSGIIEIYQNEDTRPSKTIHFNWNAPGSFGIKYPAPGKFGENLFTIKDNTTLKSGQTYSLALTLPTNLNLGVDVWIVRTSGSGTLSYNKNLVENWSVSLSEEKEFIYGNFISPGGNADMPVVFNGTGECTLELRARNGGSSMIMFKHFKW
jgi:hypothetical protein